MGDRIDRLSDYSERVPYNIEGFPMHAARGRLSGYQGMAAVSHWHDDLEFGVVVEGRMAYEAGGEEVYVGEGEGIFINARQLHGNHAIDGGDCAYVCVLVHPSLLARERYTEETYVRPLLDNAGMAWMALRGGVAWQAELMAVVMWIEGAFAAGRPGLGLEAATLSIRALGLLWENMPRGEAIAAPVDRRRQTLRQMVGFVQRNYGRKVGLAEIAEAGNVSRGHCCAMFRRYLGQTPFEYLNRYRVEKGIELLEKPELTVTQIAMLTGFSGASFFAEMFRRYVGMSPTAYRRDRT